MKPRIIEYAPSVECEPTGPIPYDVAVTLDRRIEYMMILPVLMTHLEEEIDQRKGVECEHLYSRWLEIGTFLQGLEAVPYDSKRSFALTLEETDIAARRVDEITPSESYGRNGGETRLRERIAACVGQCVGTTLLVLQAAELRVSV